MFGSEPIAKIMPFNHAANAVELAGGDIVVVWYCGSYEGGEDQRIAGAVRKLDGRWEQTRVVLDRFEYAGDTWVPEIGVPLPGPGAGGQGQDRLRGRFPLQLVLWACPRSGFRLSENPSSIRMAGGWGGGSFFPVSTIPYSGMVWRREIPTSRVFICRLDPECLAAQTGSLRALVEERGLVVMGAARRLQGGGWIVPYHTERRDCWFHSRFFVFDEAQDRLESRGDIFAEPGTLEPVVVQLPSGEVLCYMRRGGYGGHVWRAVSNDEGRTWSGPTETNLRNPFAGVDIGLSSVSGRLLVVYNDSYAQRTPLCVGLSDDGGRTLRVRDVESGPGAFAYPKLLQDRSGLWHLFYTNDYCHIQHAWFDEEWLEAGRPVFG